MVDIAARVDGKLGRITLTRPEALNALTLEMCLKITEALDRFEADPEVALVLIESAGRQAFSAGADMRALYSKGRAGDFGAGQSFWRGEYQLNVKLSEYPKPIVSLMQGFTMGGGVGLGCHVSHRVVCESACLGMPECCIGFVPDVGATQLLANAPGRIGRYLGLTGYRLDPADAIYTGFADHFIPSDRWTELTAALAQSGEIHSLIEFSIELGPSRLQANRELIDQCFETDSLSEIASRLRQFDDVLAKAALARITKSSPLAMTCALELQARLGDGGIREAVAAEYRFTFRSYEKTDFLEGLRAIIIDKDLAPQWAHPSLGELDPEEVSELLAPLGSDELQLLPKGSSS